MEEYYDDADEQYDNLYSNANDNDYDDEAMDDYYYDDDDDMYADDDNAYAYNAYDDDFDDFNIEDYADIIDQIDDPTLLQFIFEFGNHHNNAMEDGEISPEELACAKQHDTDKNGIIDENEMIGFLGCLKGAAGGYDGPDADSTVSPQEMKCGMATDKNHNGKIDKDEMAAYEACLGIDQKDK